MIWEIIGNILRTTVYSPMAVSNGNLISNTLKITVLAGLGVAGVLAVLIWKKNLATRITYIRLVIQMVAFAAFFYVFTFTFPLLYCVDCYFCDDYCFRSAVLRVALPIWLCHGLRIYAKKSV